MVITFNKIYIIFINLIILQIFTYLNFLCSIFFSLITNII